MAAPELFTGTTVTFASGFLAQILDLEWSGITRAPVETSHAGTTSWKTFIPETLKDPGTLSGTIIFDPVADTTLPIEDAAETVTLTLPSTDTWAASGFMTEFGFSGTLEEKYTATFSIKFSGAPTITDTA